MPFFYWTGHKHRHTSELLPSFNVPSGKEERLDCVNVSSRSDPGVFVANRASLPQRHSLITRASFHCAAEKLPPINITMDE